MLQRSRKHSGGAAARHVGLSELAAIERAARERCSGPTALPRTAIGLGCDSDLGLSVTDRRGGGPLTQYRDSITADGPAPVGGCDVEVSMTEADTRSATGADQAAEVAALPDAGLAAEPERARHLRVVSELGAIDGEGERQGWRSSEPNA